MTKAHNTSRRAEREARLVWVPIGLMRVPTMAQRELKPGRVDHIAANMDLEQIGTPTVNKRGGLFYIIDGQHRVEAYKQWIGEGWEDQQLHCWTYENLTEEQEAERFLKLNDTLTVQAFDKFRIGLNAGRPEETEIAAIVQRAELTISQSQSAEGSIGAVGTLRRVYRREGAAVLYRTLSLVRDAYGTAGLDAAVIDGIGLLCGRYNGDLDTSVAVTRLHTAAGGVAGLMNRAYFVKNQNGQPLNQCVAAAAVDLINRGKGGKKLPNWWRSEAA